MQYQVLNRYMYRKPILTLKDYQDLFDSKYSTLEYEKKIKKIFSDNRLKLAVYISSPSMYKALKRIDNLSPKKKRNFLINITKFLIRMSTRPTPFGLFAGVGIESLNNENNGNFNITAYFRLDLSTVYKVIEMIEKEDEILGKLNIRLNPLLYKHGNRVKLPYQSNIQNKDQHMKIMTLKNTPVLDYLFEIMGNDISFDQLVEKINCKFNVEDNVSKSFLKQLMENDLLFSDLRPDFNSNDPFKNLIKILVNKNINHEIIGKLKRIDVLLDEINYSKGDISIDKLVEFKDLLKYFNFCGERDLRVDAKLTESSEMILDYDDINNLQELSEVLSFLGNVNPLKTLQLYKNLFIEKYGIYQEVPILELLDEDLGLGKPEDYLTENNSQLSSSEDFKTICNIIQRWQTEALINNEDIILDDKKISELQKYIDKREIRKSNIDLEVFFNYFRYGNSNKFYLVPNTGSNLIGQTYGRFKYMFDLKDIDHLQHFNESITDMNRNVNFADLKINPDNSSIANIINSPSVYKNEINICTNPSETCINDININNLVVGIDNDKFYVKDSTVNKIVIPKIHNMYNYESANLIYRFLADIGAQYNGIWGNINHYFFDSMVYPKVIYKNIIISPKRWIFHHIFNERLSEVEFIEIFLEWCSKNKITNYIYLAEYDHKLLLNINNDLHLSIIYQEFLKLEKNERLSFFECEENIFQSANKRFEECVFSIKQTERSNLTITNTIYKKRQYIDDLHRLKLLGSDWISLRLNYVDSRMEEFLSNGYQEFYQYCKRENKIEKGFYVRYADSSPHLRVRFKISKNEKYNTFLTDVVEWLEKERLMGVINDFSLVSYNPEIERYGGNFLIDIAEEIFSIDSLIVANSFKEGIPLSRDLFGCFNIISMLKSFKLTFEEQLEILDMAINPKFYNEEYRKNQSILDSIVMNIYPYVPTDENIFIPDKLFCERATVIEEYSDLINENKNILTNEKADIVASILHMHSNRLNGIDRNLENKILGMCYHTIKKYMNLIKYKYCLLI